MKWQIFQIKIGFFSKYKKVFKKKLQAVTIYKRIFANNENYNDVSDEHNYNLIENRQQKCCEKKKSKLKDEDDDSCSDEESSGISSNDEYEHCNYASENHLLERIWRVANYEVYF